MMIYFKKRLICVNWCKKTFCFGNRRSNHH